MEIIYLENGIKWKNGDCEVTYEADNIEFAADSLEFIYAEIINDDGNSEYRFLDLTGNEICKYDETNVLQIKVGTTWSNKEYEEIMDVYIIGGKIYAMISPTDIDVYDLSSHYIGTIKAPFGYTYYRFVDGEKLRAICQGSEENADMFGRIDCRFEYDNLTNNWVKAGVTY